MACGCFASSVTSSKCNTKQRCSSLKIRVYLTRQNVLYVQRNTLIVDTNGIKSSISVVSYTQ